MHKRVYILCRFAEFSGLYASWLPHLTREHVIVREFPATWDPPEDAGLVVTHMHYRWEEVAGLRRIMEQNRVPVLILSDGILEYRNLFEHPELAPGSIFQPLIGHKLACLGKAQARVVESWGNAGKCEVVGLPRLDKSLETPEVPVRTEGLFRLLIATANTPAFDARQRAAVLESLQLLLQRFRQNPLVGNRPVQVTWRLTDGLDKELGLPVDESGTEKPRLSEVIDQHDAVVVTPSTLFLESLLKNRPTALLDFHNKPHYVPSAWMINAPKHLNGILMELANPPEARLLFQREVLHDQLECRTPAIPRMIQLIEAMIECGQKPRQAGQPPVFPHRILADDLHGSSPIDEQFDLAKLFPQNPFFRNQEMAFLTAELNLAVSRLQGMPADNHAISERIDRMRVHAEWLARRNEMLFNRNLELRNRLRRLNGQLEKISTDLRNLPGPDEPENQP